MTTEERRRPAVGVQIKRWRGERGLTLANVAERSGLNIGYLSQIENDKASPSLTCLSSIADALEVPAAWFLIDDVPAPVVVRAAERPVSADGSGPDRARGRAVVARCLDPRGEAGPRRPRVGAHAHAGEEHHFVLRGRYRLVQGDHVIDVGPGDYVRWDGTIPHDGELLELGPDGDAAMLIIRIRPKD